MVLHPVTVWYTESVVVLAQGVVRWSGGQRDAPSQGSCGVGAVEDDGLVRWTPPREVTREREFLLERKFLAGPAGLTDVGGLIVNNKINLIICDGRCWPG